MGALIGFMVGYYLGTKAGPNGIEELMEAWRSIQESEDFQGLVQTVKATAESTIQQGIGAAMKLVGDLTQAGGEFGASQLKELAGANGNLQGVWDTLSQSAEVRGLVSSGTALIAQLLAQGTAAARERMQ
jgi:hypothetical protein